MTHNPFQRPPYYDWGLDRWKIGAALLLFALLLFWLLKAPPAPNTPSSLPPTPSVPSFVTLSQPLPGSVEAGTNQLFSGSAPANSPVVLMDSQLGELGRTQAKADGGWTLDTGTLWTAGAYRLQAVALDPATGQAVGRSTVMPVVALAFPPVSLTLAPADLSADGSSLTLSGQAPPGVTVSAFDVAGDQRTLLGQAQADGDARWQIQSLVSAGIPGQVALVARDPTGAILAESAPTTITLSTSDPSTAAPLAETETPAVPTPETNPTAEGVISPTLTAQPPIAVTVQVPGLLPPANEGDPGIALGLDNLGPGSQIVDGELTQLSGTGLANSPIQVSVRYYPPGEPITDLDAVAERLLGTTAADIDGHWQLPLSAPLAWGRHDLTLRQFDQTDQLLAQIGPIPVQVLAPGLRPEIDLPVIRQPSMNSHVSGQDLHFAGTALPGSRLRLEFSRPNPPENGDETQALPSALAWVINDGSWSVALGETLSPGSYRVQAVILDPAGEESGRSLFVDFDVASSTLPVAVVVPTLPSPSTPPVAPPPVMVGTRLPRFAGRAEANRLLRVQIIDGAGNSQQGFVNAGADGHWRFVPAFPLAPGMTQATVQVVGAWVTAQDDLSVLIPESAGMSGALATGLQVMAPLPGLLTNRLPAIHGLAAPGAHVVVRINDQVAATAQADAYGNWYALPSAPLAVGDQWLVVSAENADGSGDEVGPLVLTVTAQTPTVPAPALDPALDPARFILTGVAQPGQTLDILLNGASAATVTANASGRWGWQPDTPQAEGPIYVQARILDAAGHVLSETGVQVIIYFVPLGG